MRHRVIFLFIFLCLAGVSPQVFAQEEPEYLDRFDIVFTRGFMLMTGEVDSMPVSSGRSGTYFIGLGFNFDVNKHLAFRVTPGFSWLRINYKQKDANKTFPTTVTDLEDERHRIANFDLSAGSKINFNHNDGGKPIIFLEVGGFGGVKISGAYKTKAYDEPLEQTTRVRISGVKDLENWRYGIYGKLGYRWISIYYNYRLSEVFQEFRTDAAGTETNFRNTSIPKMEMGIAIHL